MKFFLTFKSSHNFKYIGLLLFIFFMFFFCLLLPNTFYDVQCHKAFLVFLSFILLHFTFKYLPKTYISMRWMSRGSKCYKEMWNRLSGIKSDRVTSFRNDRTGNLDLLITKDNYKNQTKYKTSFLRSIKKLIR